MRFDDIFARASISDLQILLSSSTLKLINLLDSKSLSTAALRNVILDLNGYDGLLLDENQRYLLFDLMRETEAQELLQALGEPPSANPYESLKKLSFRHKGQREKLFAFLGLPLPEREKTHHLTPQETLFPLYPLFLHQQDAVKRIQEKLSTRPYRVILHMPTGSGKTRTAMNVIAEHLRQKEQTIVIWLAYSEELCEQAAEEFSEAWRYLGNRPLELYRFWGVYDIDMSDISDGVVIVGLAKIYSRAKSSAKFISDLGKRASLVIIDEAHSAIAETYKFILETLVVFHPNTAILGLTATPGRTWADIHIDEELATFFARQKVSLKIPEYENPVDYLVDQGYLAKVDYYPLHTRGLDLTDADIYKIEEDLDIPESILKRLAEDEIRNLLIIQKIEEMVQRHWRIMIFAATVEHSGLLASVLRWRGFDARSITSKTPASERKQAIQAFKDDREIVRILCNYGVLTTGFDAPRTSAALIARPTKSLVLYSQMVGRAIRGRKAGGNDRAEIVTVIDSNLPGFGSVAEAFNNWEDIWE